VAHFVYQRLLIFCGVLCFACGLSAQTTTSQATASCAFDANKQLAVNYARITINSKHPVFGREIPYDHVWAPGGKPLTLFLNSPVRVGGKELPVGAYTLFIIPSEKAWTLVVSKSTDTSGKYDERQDIARIPMEHGQLGTPENEFSVYFAHIAPQQCSMRVDLEKHRAWVVFQEK
jgi:hypothetical protein